MKRYLIEVRGLVEGVGFRPFVYRTAIKYGLKGYVKNDSTGVFIEVEGKEKELNSFIQSLKDDKPRASEIHFINVKELEPLGYDSFRIEKSSESDEKLPVIPPDLGICEECKSELLSPNDKRYYYPFINCTDCGPRFSIVKDVPYDRINTSMSVFRMCEYCKNEYEDMMNRRFHAQPVACFDCGPIVELYNSNKERVIELPRILDENNLRDYTKKVISTVQNLILQGKIIAIKGIGGFQIVCRADVDDVVLELRKRKRREEKPFALMFRDINEVRKYCHLGEKEEKLLTSYISPIVLLRKKDNVKISDYVSPRNPFLGCMIPYSPLHVLIMDGLDVPIVCTSANISNEPICIGNEEAFNRLSGIVDFYLLHNRDIVRHVDDSVVKITPKGNEILIRRARGYVPSPIVFDEELPDALALGGHLKNTIAVSTKNYVILSQHIGDLETFESINAFNRSIDDFLRFYNIKPNYIVCDLHPDYISTKIGEELAEKLDVKLIKVQHHLSHTLSCMADNGIIHEDVIGVAWDGTGYGFDGKIWGSEFFVIKGNEIKRTHHLLPIKLLGGEKAIKEVYRIGLSLLLDSSFSDNEVKEFFNEFVNTGVINTGVLNTRVINTLISMYKSRVYVESQGVGRLFDGVSSIVGISHKSTFEGQSAMELEFESLLYGEEVNEVYDFRIVDGVIDWREMIRGIVEDLRKGVPRGYIGRKFHNTLVRVIEVVVKELSNFSGIRNVVLSGGVFQNSIILDKTLEVLESEGFNVFVHKKVPPNDGGISLGQIAYILKFIG
jgi:hydrogenase maturation protein HypF